MPVSVDTSHSRTRILVLIICTSVEDFAVTSEAASLDLHSSQLGATDGLFLSCSVCRICRFRRNLVSYGPEAIGFGWDEGPCIAPPHSGSAKQGADF